MRKKSCAVTCACPIARLYADYSLTTRPSNFDSQKWARFRAESAASTMSAASALALGKYWQQVRNSYGGNIPPEKMAYIQALLGAQALRVVAPVAESFVNSSPIDLSTVTVGDFDLSLAQIETTFARSARHRRQP